MNTVIENIKTVVERNILLNFLDQFNQIIYNIDMDVKSFIINNSQPQNHDSLFKYLGNDMESRNVESLLLKSKELEKELLVTDVITLTVAIPPTSELVSTVSDWLRETTGNSVFLDFKIEKDLIGGAVIETGERIKDYSVKEYFKKRKEHSNGL